MLGHKHAMLVQMGSQSL